MNKRLTPILILTSALWLFGLSAKAQTIGGSVYGGGNKAAVTGAVSVEISAGEVKQNVFGGGNLAGINNTTGQTDGTATVTIEGGIIGSHTTDPNTYGIYGGCNSEGTVADRVQVNIKGGTLGRTGDNSYRLKGVYGGGLGQNTNTSGNVEVIIGENSNPTIYGDVYGGSALGKVNGTSVSTTLHTTVTMKNGVVYGDIYGGGLGQLTGTGGAIQAMVYSPVTVTVEGGSVSTYTAGTETKGGNVFGCNNLNGAPQSTAQVDITGGTVSANVYGGGNLATYGTVGSNYPVVNVSGGSVANVFGGGMGSSDPDKGVVTGNPQVTVSNNGAVSSNVYGGGQLAKTIGNPSVSVTGGGAAMVFGGGMQAGIQGGPTVSISGGTVSTGVYGGCNESGTVDNKATVSITGGTIGNSGNTSGVVYGGGLGEATKVKGDVAVTISNAAATVNGDVYGGSAKGLVNCNDAGTGATSGSKTDVTLTAGTVNGNLYGGGHGLNSQNAHVYGPVTVAINGGSVRNVFGGNNLKGTPQNTIVVGVGGGSINNVYGGGNQAAYTYTGNYPAVNITNGTVTGSVFGGGKGSGAAVTGNPTVVIGDDNGSHKAVVSTNVYGGGDEAAVTGSTSVTYNDNGTGSSVGIIFGGGNKAAVSAGTHVTLSNGTVTDVYGGGAFADVGTLGTTTVTASQHIVDILGGQVNGNVYGGGLGGGQNPNNSNQPYAPKVNGIVRVNIGSGTVASNGTVSDLAGNASFGANSSVYGCNDAYGSPQDDVTVNIFQTAHTNGTNNTPNNTLNGTAFAIKQVFGGGRKAHYAPQNGNVSSTKRAHVNVYTCNNTIEDVFGGGDAADAVGVVTLIKGGRFNRIFGGGNGAGNHIDPTAPDYNPGANIGSGGVTLTINGGQIGSFFGGSNAYGSINGPLNVNVQEEGPCGLNITDFFCGSNMVDINGSVNTTIACGSGTAGMNITNLYGGSNLANISGDVTLTVKGGIYTNVFGGSKGDAERLNSGTVTTHTNNPANIGGKVTLNLMGGTIENAYGGSDVLGNIGGKIEVNMMDDGNTDGCPLVIHNVYGGGRDAFYTPDSPGDYPEVNIIHGTVTKKTDGTGGNVFGGGYGETAVVKSNPKVRIGYDETMSSVIPSGYGVAVADRNAIVQGNVYGGGDQAAVAGITSVTIQKSGSSVASLFGGGNQASVGKANVSVTGGNVSVGVYGGCNTSGYVGGSINSYSFTTANNTTTINTNSNTFDGNIAVGITSSLGTTTPLTEGIYGGGKGNDTHTKGTVTVTIDKATTQGATAPVIYSDVYGGSALGQVGDNNMLTKVDFKDGELHGVIYGGGMGCVQDANHPVAHAAEVTGNVEVAVSGGSISGTTIAGTTTKGGVFGGCNVNGFVKGSSIVGITNGTVPANVYGGGLGETTTVEGKVEVTIGSNSTITGDVYGGSAQGLVNYTYNSTSSTYSINEGANIFTNVTLGGGAVNGNIYGGGHGLGNKEANVGRAVTVTINSGSVSNVFGCNNVYGAPKRDVTVNINSNVANGTIYGGGNLAAYQAPAATQQRPNNPMVNINKGTVANVFGGGLGSTAIVTGAPSVTVGDLTSGHENDVATVSGDVYGGGDAADVRGTTSVLVQKCNTVIGGNVYGGGNAANIDMNNSTGGTTSVTITGGLINNAADDKGNVFGGGHGNAPSVAANVAGNTGVVVNGGTIKRVFGGSNSKGDIGGSTSVLVQKVSDACTMDITEVYGGGNEAEGNAGSINIVCTGGENEGIKDVYGGARKAEVNGDITLNITGGKINRVFGGNNVSGVINGDITVNVDWGTGCSNNSLNYVFGGGNNAAYTQKTAGHPQVNIKNGTVSYNVFGGGLGSTATVTGNPVVNIQGGTVSGTTFGGGSAAPVVGNPTVNALYGSAPIIHGGGQGASAKVTGDPTVILNKTANQTLSVTDIYGGGDLAEVEGNTSVQLKVGSVTNAFGGGNKAVVTGTTSVSLEGASASNLFGGGNEAGVTNTATVSISSGNVSSGVYGGCNTTGTVGGTATVNVTGGTVGTDATHTANIYGGGLGENTRMSGDVAVNIGATSGGNNPTYSGNATIYGDVYGGSAKGKTNCNEGGTAHLGETKTDVTLYSGTVNGDLYGGGHGPDGQDANVYGPVAVLTKGGSVNNVFGGNNVAGMPKSTVQVDIQGGTISSNVYGGGNLAIYGTAGSNYPVVNITSGSVVNVFGGGMGSSDPTKGVVTGNPQVTVNGGTVSSDVYGGGQLAKTIGNPNVSISSGSAAMVFGGGMQAGIQGAPTVSIEGGTVSTGVYGGCNVSGTVDNKATVSITGGTIGNSGNTTGVVYGGGLGEDTKVKGDVAVTISNASATVNGDVYGGSAKGLVNCNDAGTGATTGSKTDVTLSAGTINGNLYGGGHGLDNQEAHVYGPVTVAINGGSVKNVFGGNNLKGTPQNTIQVGVGGGTINNNVYGGGNEAAYSYSGNYPAVSIVDGTVTGSVFGGGKGSGAAVTGNPTVVVGDNNESHSAKVTANVYGGGDEAAVTGNTSVTYDDNNATSYVGNIYGGGNEAEVSGSTQVTINNGKVNQDVYGGGAFASTGATTVDILGGTITHNIYGGGLGDGTHEPDINGVVHVNIGKRITEPSVDTIGSAIIGGSVFGCNNAAGSPQDNVYVDVWKTYQDGPTLFNGNGYAIANVFGGGNEADFNVVNKKANVYIHGCDNTIRRVFGGGNNADAWGVATTIDGGRFEYVFGGGNGEGDGHEANIGLGGASLTIMGGNVGQFFGGSNEHGTITGELTVTATSGECGLDIENFFCGSNQVYIAGDVNTTITCNGSMNVKNLYGGSNLANIGGNVTLTVEGGTYENVFGGSKGDLANNRYADIAKDVTLNLYGGTIDNAFGGSDDLGRIFGKITVNVIDDKSMANNVETCPLVLHNVYGGGRKAFYQPTIVGAYPEVNIIHGEVTKKAVTDPNTNEVTYTGGNVFGGGLGAEAIVTSNPKVTIGYASGYTYPANATQPQTPKAEVRGNVYGGGDLAQVTGSPVVMVQKNNTRLYSDVYGGGNLANVSGSTTVTVNEGIVSYDVYGGGALAHTGGSTVTLAGGQVRDLYGGGLGRAAATGIDPIAAQVNGPVSVTVNGGTVNDVFGCNNVNGAPTQTVQVNINSDVSGNVYGGGNLAGSLSGNNISPIVYINKGTVTNVFGGGNGDPNITTGETAVITGNPEVVIGDSDGSHEIHVTNVYGGGNAAKVAGNTKVTYNDNNTTSTVAKLFGGGNAAGVTGTTEVNMNQGKVINGIYGGCNSKGTVGGAISVNIKGGSLGANGATLAEGIYGGGYGKDTETGDDVTVTIGYGGTTPTIYGDVYGGSALGKVSASSKLTKVDFLNGTLNGTLYGGGKGQTGNTPVSAEVKGDVQVAIANGSISGGVYGGCNLNGDVKGNIMVDVNGASIGAEGAPASVFGGGYGNNTTTEGNVIVNLNGTSATVWGDIYGGSAEGNVNKVNNNNTTTVNILNGTVKRDIYGGGLGTNDYAAAVNGAVVVNIGSDENTGNAILNGNVYGCNNTNGSPQDNVTVNIYKTHREASQETSGTGFAIANVFGGGNQAAYSPTGTQTASVIIHGCSNTIEDVFGGGDAAAVKKAAVEVNGGRFNRVFAGGNGEVTAANIGSGGTSLLVKAGKIHQLFGGSNERGVIEGPITVTLNHDNTTCVEEIDEFFGGSNLAAIGTDANPATLVTTIECGVGTITDVYGGSNAADIIGNVTLNIEGGTITNAYGGSKGVTNGTAANIKDARNNGQPIGTHGKVTLNLKGGTVTNAYGGSNLNGNIEGEIAVNVSDQGSQTCPLKVTDIYGASNLAAYTPNTGRSTNSPAVYVKNVKSHASATNPANTVLGNVYGGGKGSSAIVTSNPLVVVGDSTSTSGNLASVANHVYGGGNAAAVNGNTKVLMQKANSTVLKLFGGGAKAGVSGSSITLNNGLVEEGVFGGCDTIGTVTNNTVILLNGGNVGTVDNPAHYGICGGGWGQPTQVGGNVAVTLNGTTAYSDIYGGSFYGDVNTNENNTTVVTLTTGTVHGNVYGGGLGDRETSVFAKVNGKVTVNVNGGTVNGDVFGCNNDYGAPQSTVNVTMDGGTVRSVIGGGNMADYVGIPVVNISGGEVLSQVVGGGNAADVVGSNITISGGNIATSDDDGRGVYGGCNLSNDVTGNALVNITGGTIGTSTNHSNIFGGGYGKDTRVGNNVEVQINGASATIWGDIYGGSALGNVNGNTPDASKHTYVTFTNGTVKGDIYGGGLGNNDPDVQAAAKVNGAVAVSINGGKVEGNVYGCNNVYGAPHSTVKVDVYSSNGTIANVFGGGNVAGYSGTPDVTIHNCDNSIGYVYGGGNKASVDGTNVRVYGGDIEYVFGGGNGEGVAANFQMVDGNAVANIYGGTIDHVFGGNNSSGAISGTVTVNVDKQTESGHNSCDMYIGEVYGGGNLAAGNAGTITIGCTGSLVSGADGHIAHPEKIGTTLEGVGTVYGGANQAGIGNDIQLDINNGIVNKVFGGNNTSGNIDGTIQVNIEKTGTCDWYVGEVYGGGNHAEYAGTPDVNIIAGTVYRNVYGGGNDITDGTKGVLDSDVEMTGGTVLGGVYGGCNLKGTVTGNSLVKIYGGTVGSQDQLEATPRVVAQVFGGGLGANTKVNGNVTVNVNKGDGVATAPIIWGDVYGGSALGSVNTNNENTTTVIILDGTLGTKTTTGTTPNGQTYYNYFGGNVFGGGLGDDTDATKGQVKGKVFVNIGTTPSGRSRDLDPVNDTCIGNATIKGNVYGCNNTNGSPLDDVTVNIYRTHRDATDEINYIPESGDPEPTFAIANVFGGGNRANYTASGKTASVNIFSCYNSIQRVFGGGNAAAAPNVHTNIQGGRFAEVFGGGNGEVSAANITGNVNLEIHGGTVGEFYVGSNQNGSISGTSNVTVDQSSGCEEVNITEFYCGGKYADFVGDINATITCSQDMHVTNLYGGCKEAHVKAGNGGSGNIHLTVVGGTFENVYGGSRGTQTKGADIEGNITLDIFGGTITKAIYGGSNVKGAIGGTITVNVEDKYPNDNCSLEVSTADVYGGGNQADYPGVPAPDSPITGTITHTSPYNYPEVNIKNATVKNVFGGGLNATVTGNPQIFIKNKAKVLGNVYGGGNMGEVNGNPKVIVNGKMQ